MDAHLLFRRSGLWAALVLAAAELQAGPSAPPAQKPLPLGLPVQFEANLGQTDSRVQFLSRGAGRTLFLTPREAVLALGPGRGAAGATVRMRFQGAAANPALSAEVPLPGVVNYFRWGSPAPRVKGVPTSAAVRYRGLYPGTDLLFHGRQGRLEYDFILGPGADPGRIRLAFTGMDRLALEPGGGLVLRAGGVELRQPCPAIYQERNGVRTPVPGRFRLLGRNRVGLALGPYDRARTLVVDPSLDWVFLDNGSANEAFTAVAVCSDQSVVAAGSSQSPTFPNLPTPGASNSNTPLTIVAKFMSLTPAPAYSNTTSYVTNQVVSSQGMLWVALQDNPANNTFGTGTVSVPPDPSTNQQYWKAVAPVPGTPIQPWVSGGSYSAGPLDPFTGSLTIGSLVTDQNNIYGAIQNSGPSQPEDPTQSTSSYWLRLTGDPIPAQAVFTDIFEGSSQAFAVGVDHNHGDPIYFAGAVYGGFPASPLPATPGLQPGFQPTYGGGGCDGFIARLEPDGSKVDYLSCLGGSGDDAITALAVDGQGIAYVAGWTTSSNWQPDSHVGPFKTFGAGTCDAFLAAVDPNGNLTRFSFLGGSGAQAATGIALDLADPVPQWICVCGWTTSTDFPGPTLVAPASAVVSQGAAFVTRMAVDASGNWPGLAYTALLGGPGSGSIVATAGSNNFSNNIAGVLGPGVSSQGTPILQGVLPSLGPAGSGSTAVNVANTATGLAVDTAGCAYVTGITLAPGSFGTPDAFSFPVPSSSSSYTPQVAVLGSLFLAKLDPAGQSLVYSTAFGDLAAPPSIAVDPQGAAYVVGTTPYGDPNFPQVPAIFTSTGGNSSNSALSYTPFFSGFMLRMDSGGDSLDFCSIVNAGQQNPGDFIFTGVAVTSDGMVAVGSPTSTSGTSLNSSANSLSVSPFGALAGKLVLDQMPLPIPPTSIIRAPGTVTAGGTFQAYVPFQGTAALPATYAWATTSSGLTLTPSGNAVSVQVPANYSGFPLELSCQVTDTSTTPPTVSSGTATVAVVPAPSLKVIQTDSFTGPSGADQERLHIFFTGAQVTVVALGSTTPVVVQQAGPTGTTLDIPVPAGPYLVLGSNGVGDLAGTPVVSVTPDVPGASLDALMDLLAAWGAANPQEDFLGHGSVDNDEVSYLENLIRTE
jgi:hypothetical protein